MDFVSPNMRSPKKDVHEIYPKFKVCKSKDLMIRGGDFYAVWNDKEKVWATDQDTVVRLIDDELDEYAKSVSVSGTVVVKHMRDSESGSIDKWRHYVQKQMEDNWVSLDGKLIFSNTEAKREDYSSHRLDYPLKEGDYSAFDELLGRLYSPDERMKIEWAIGAVVTGDSVNIQKFIVLTGDAGTGKSTVLKIVDMLFKGYTSVIDAQAIGSANSSFALESLKKDPLVAMQHDADLSSIKDNTRLNSIISHERMTVNEKFKSPYEHAYRCFIFLGSNEDVKITDSRSGIQRRLIDVRPTGKTFDGLDYDRIMSKIPFELGAIAYHCKTVYEAHKHKYDRYKPTQSLRNTNVFYNFMEENFEAFKNGVGLNDLWKRYQGFCDENQLLYKMDRLQVKKEATPYFKKFIVDGHKSTGQHVRNFYDILRVEKFGIEASETKPEMEKTWIEFNCTKSLFDEMFSDCPAQYPKKDGFPRLKWKEAKTKLKDLDTSKLHWVKTPLQVIKIDFDRRGADGEKSLEENLKEANKFPRTYAEVSRSGQGIHLFYIYDGDVSQLSRIYDAYIEIITSEGDRAHRRMLTKCNDIPIATINSGLPLKGGKPLVDENVAITEKALRTTIKRCLAKEIHGDTRSNIDWIYQILEKAYNSGVIYDVSDMRQEILIFAINSTHQSKYCVNKVREMKFASEEKGQNDTNYDDRPIVFFDVEVFPNLFIVCWKYAGENNPVRRMINPSPDDISEMLKMKLVGFNNRDYDNHILYARWMGKSNSELYYTSKAIIGGEKGAKFREAYNLSYTDIYDFSSKKQSLKEWEIDLDIHHHELGFPWDDPVPEDKWELVADYCVNDVIATEAVFNHLKEDWKTRQILADLAGGSVNDTTNTLTLKLVFGDNKKPILVYTDLATGEQTEGR